MSPFVASNLSFSGRRECLTSFFLPFFCALERRRNRRLSGQRELHGSKPAGPENQKADSAVARHASILTESNVISSGVESAVEEIPDYDPSCKTPVPRSSQRGFNRFVTAIIRDAIARKSRVKKCSHATKDYSHQSRATRVIRDS